MEQLANKNEWVPIFDILILLCIIVYLFVGINYVLKKNEEEERNEHHIPPLNHNKGKEDGN